MFRVLYKLPRTNVNLLISASDSSVQQSSIALCWLLNRGVNHCMSSFSTKDVSAITVGELYKSWTIKMSLAGVPEAQKSAELIIANTFQLPELNNMLSSVTLTPDQVSHVKMKCEKRMNRIPLQYILGECNFYDLTLKMQPPVFIPQPETEQLVCHILNYLEPNEKDRKNRFLEIGCGSGAVSLALLHKLTQWSCVATDVVEEARDLSYENAHLCHMSERIQVIEHDIVKGIDKLQEFPSFNFLVCNPPRTSNEDIKTLLPEDKFYKHSLCYDGGEDGLNVVKAVVKAAQYLVERSGSVWIEVNYEQVTTLYQWIVEQPDLGLRMVNILVDHTGRDRFFHFLKT
ncbi:MTRF1L release factor glutamine methyltransferase-like [Argonauta hians]